MHASKFAASLFAAALWACARAASDTYDLNPQHTQPTFDVIRLGFLHTPGVFTDATGLLVLDREALTGRIEVTIKMASLTTGSPSRDEYLKGKDFFNVTAYPTATVTAQDFSLAAQYPLQADGTLTMLGVSKPVKLTIESMRCEPASGEQKAVCRGRVSTHIQRSDWGMSKYLLFVANTVTITVDVKAIGR